MNITTKKRNIIIAILISCALILAMSLGVIFYPRVERADADTYNYGDFHGEGYYTLDGVVFYAIKVKTVEGVELEPYLPSSDGENYSVVIAEIEYTFVKENGDITKLTYGTNQEIIVANKYFSIGSITYVITTDENGNPTSVDTVSYWPTYDVVMEDEKPVFVKFGEVVLLEEDESILICFAKQTTSEKDDDIYVVNGEQSLSASIDYLAGKITINGEALNNANENTISNIEEGGFEKELGYLINLNGNDLVANEPNIGLGSAKNTSEKNYEGLIEFSAGYETGDSNKEFSFMFYAFKKATYQRPEELNSSATFDRPSAEITASDYVLDSATKEQYFAEYFYYFANQNLPYLEFEYQRYEVGITKIIHGTSTEYTISYDNAGTTNDSSANINNVKLTTQTTDLSTGKIVQIIEQNLSTVDLYARGFIIEEVFEDENPTGKVKVYFSDIGVYNVSYTAVYYNGNNEKVYLDTLNQDSRQDRLTVFGTEMTYQDINKGQTPFRNDGNTISADVTGTGFAITPTPSTTSTTCSITTPNNFVIASTNQPQINLLFNARVSAEEFKVYFSEDNITFTDETNNYSYTSGFTMPGYYVVKTTSSFDNYKSWLGTSASYLSRDTEQTYYFQIKNQTPELELYVLGDDGNIVGQANRTRVYANSFVKNGVQIIEVLPGSDFDSQTTLSMRRTGFNQASTQAISITLPNTPANQLTANQISYLAQYGITKYEGYYVVKPINGVNIDGRYELILNFGKSGRTTSTFNVDTEAINGVKAYSYSTTGSSGLQTYTTGLLSSQGTLVSTNSPFALLWNDKTSGAKITAKYVRYVLTTKNYLDSTNVNYDDYIINDTWLAADYQIILSATNPETLYTKAGSRNLIDASFALGESGLYVFKLEDQAGNVAYFSILVDNSIPTVLQKTANSAEIYQKITGANNVSEATRIFFGSHKAIAFSLNGELVAQNSSGLNTLLSGTTVSSQYLNAFFSNLNAIDSSRLIKTNLETNELFAAVPIVNIFEKTNSTTLSPAVIAQGYCDVLPSYDENNRMRDVQYFYQIFDASNLSKKTPTTSYKLKFNTDQTGITIYTDKEDSQSDLTLIATQTGDDLTYRNKFYIPTDAKIVYLSWNNLWPTESLDAFVDLENNGLRCFFYELIYDANKNSYYYSEIPTEILLNFSSITEDQQKNGNIAGNLVRIAINVVNGETLAGKYEIVRTYSPYSGEQLGNLGNDYEIAINTFFIDRTPIISSQNEEDARTGNYTYVTLFDGVNSGNKEYYNTLYQQSQANNANYVVQTNKLPIGFYIPVSKYGTVYEIVGGVLGVTPISLEDVQKGEVANYKYVNLVNFTELDQNEKGISTYSPFGLTVVLISPAKATDAEGREVNIYYYYSYSSQSGYFMLSGYSLGELGVGQDPTAISNYSYFVKNNPITNSSEYATGTYVLQIGAIENMETNTYEQNFKFLINVVAKTPECDIVAQYPELNTEFSRMEDREIQSDGIYYWINSNTIKISWIDSSNEYVTKIDTDDGKISVVYYIGSAKTTVAIPSPGNQNEFTIVVPKNVEKIVVTMIYETYSDDSNRNYRPYYQGESYQVTKTMCMDIQAPTASISNLINGDVITNGLLSDQLRESSDSRFNKSITTGIYKYYSYMSSTYMSSTNMSSINFLEALSDDLAKNSSLNTKYFYYRQFTGKYTEAIIYETGLGLDSTSRADNLFSEYLALSNGWTKITGSQKFSNMEGYYEIIEFDLAGNMTIYTIYITNGQKLEIGFDKKTNEVQGGTITIGKDNNQINASVKVGNVPTPFTNISNSKPIVVESYDNLKLKSIKFYNVEGSDFYRYLKIVIDGTIYLVTPFNYENIGTSVESNIVCTSLVKLDGSVVDLEDIPLLGQAPAHNITVYDSVNKITGTTHSAYSIQAKVVSTTAKLTDNGGAVINYNIATIGTSGRNLALTIKASSNSALTIANDDDAVLIYQIKGDGTYKLYSLKGAVDRLGVATNASNTITYYYIEDDGTFATSVFYILFRDNFGNEYFNLVEYNAVNFDRYQGDYDVYPEMQERDEIIVSGDIAVNISNLYDVELVAGGNYTEIQSSSIGASYSQYQLFAETRNLTAGYIGGSVKFDLSLRYNIPDGIRQELEGKYEIGSDSDDVIKTISVTIYNQVPEIKVTTMAGYDITNQLFDKTITQSEAVVISFISGSEVGETLGYAPKAFLRLRGSETGYVEITSPYTVSEVGVYDVYIQNYDEDGNALDYVLSYDFVISDLDVMFYTVVKTNGNGEKEIVSPTGRVFEYTTGAFAQYHYIINTSEWEVLTNGVNVTKSDPVVFGNTTVYSITGRYKATIAITVVEESTNILGNGFIWYLGTTYSSPSADNYIRSTNKEIYLCADDIYDEITLRWASYYGVAQNKITCYISSDEGSTWVKARGIDNGTHTTLTLSKSSSYLFKFVDCAGNYQIFSSSSGYPSITTKVNFIRSVLYKINGENPVDNAVYNSEVALSLPIHTLNFYSTAPVIRVLRNNQEYSVAKDANGNYLFTEPGTYVVYFSVKVKGGTKDLNEDQLTFTIINPNDARWAFNYVNYNNYSINYVKYNDNIISTGLKNYALSTLNEINISAFDEDALGNKWFNNGKYTIKMTRVDDALGTQSFEFSFWLNDSTPPITVSLPENESTTSNVEVGFNKGNLFEILGDCYIMVDNRVIATVDAATAAEGGTTYNVSGIGSHYIQVYTSSGKLVYSYKVQIDEPLNTITIILIVVSCVVVAGGSLLFFLLRKKMKVR